MPFIKSREGVPDVKQVTREARVLSNALKEAGESIRDTDESVNAVVRQGRRRKERKELNYLEF